MGNIFTRSPSIQQLHEQFAIEFVYDVCNKQVYYVPIINKAYQLLLFLIEHTHEEYIDEKQTINARICKSSQFLYGDYQYQKHNCFGVYYNVGIFTYLCEIAKTNKNNILHEMKNSEYTVYKININFDCRDLNCIIHNQAIQQIPILQQKLSVCEQEHEELTLQKQTGDLDMQNVKNKIFNLEIEMQQNYNRMKTADKQTKSQLVDRNIATKLKIDMLKQEQQKHADLCRSLDETKRNIDKYTMGIANLQLLLECMEYSDEQGSCSSSVNEKMVAESVSGATVIEPKNIA
jgi:hypothetical protein